MTVRPIVQLLQGMIHKSEKDLNRIQKIVQSLPPESYLRHTLRNLQHAELLRLNMLHAVLKELPEPPA
ncbi:MAG TPA: hypothetical protein VJU82_01765 [Acidobacteriaceae bacterium]|nr:hypothetical protein [Acidobacteriaceae bacterium]